MENGFAIDWPEYYIAKAVEPQPVVLDED
jgi:hypothetical protein